MDGRTIGELQIYAVEEAAELDFTCIVRCVGGIVHAGQRFGVESAVASVTLEWIECYGRRVDRIDPPHSGKVCLTGSGVSLLKEGLIITSVMPD